MPETDQQKRLPLTCGPIPELPSSASTECPKIYRKSVLYLLKYTANLYCICLSTPQIYTQMHYRVAVNFGTLSNMTKRHLEHGLHSVMVPFWDGVMMNFTRSQLFVSPFLGLLLFFSRPPSWPAPSTWPIS